MVIAWQDLVRHAAFAALAAMLATTLFAVILKPLALKAGLVDRPGGRKLHAMPTPAIGGLAITLGAAPFVLFLLPLTAQLRGFGLAALIIVIVGAADDRLSIRWYYKVCAQIAAALVMVYVGGIRVDHIGAVFGVEPHTLGLFAVPVTVLATVGIINAINMADGVDGLAGGLAVVTLSLLAAAAVYAGNDRLSSALVLLIGALCAFLAFNLRTPWNPKAQLFLGNAGSEFLGLVIACASFRLTQNGHHPVGPQLAPFLVALPLIDCLTLIVRRLRAGASPFKADRNHLHHLMLDAGMTPTWIVILVSSATLAIGSAAALALRAHAPAPAFLIAFLGLLLGYFRLTHRRDVAVDLLARWNPAPNRGDRGAVASISGHIDRNSASISNVAPTARASSQEAA